MEVINIIEQDFKEKSRKWDQVVEYLEISGVFVECDEEIVMDVLKMGTLNSDKVKRCKKHIDFIDIETASKSDLKIILGTIKERLEATTLYEDDFPSRKSKGERTP